LTQDIPVKCYFITTFFYKDRNVNKDHIYPLINVSYGTYYNTLTEFDEEANETETSKKPEIIFLLFLLQVIGHIILYM
jgi:hypothetical protein